MNGDMLRNIKDDVSDISFYAMREDSFLMNIIETVDKIQMILILIAAILLIVGVIIIVNQVKTQKLLKKLLEEKYKEEE